jgi:fibronectin type 3 domain-containing protein
MAFRKHSMLAFALLAVIPIAFGCAEDVTAPNTQDEAPVLAPTNVQAIVRDGGVIEISWDPSSQPSVNGYNVYRGEVGKAAPTRINASRVRATTYTDRTARPSREYEYRVTAVSSKGSESRFAAVQIENRRHLRDGKIGPPTVEE